MKNCRICHQTKPIEQFVRNRKAKDGYLSTCKPCHAQGQADWRAKNPEHKRAYDEYWRASRAEHKRTYDAQWQKDHPEYITAFKHRRKAKKQQNGGSHTKEEWQALCAQFNHCCAHCGERKRLQRDHVVPISKGGSDDIENIQPLCARCNQKKYTKIIDYRTFEEVMNRAKRPN